MNALNQRIRASDVDPREGPATFIEDPMREMANFDSLYEQHPGRAPGGSGTTGLQSSDARGYSDMLNERLRYMRLRAMLSGEDEPTVRADPRSNFRSALQPMSGPRDWSRMSDWSQASPDQPGSALTALQARLRGGYTSPEDTRRARTVQSRGGAY
jgi:hypothetical protein